MLTGHVHVRSSPPGRNHLDSCLTNAPGQLPADRTLHIMGFLEGLFWLTLNIYHEARGEPPIGKLAVAHVTLNRAVKNNQNLEEVVLAPYQFSWIIQKESYIPTEPGAFMDCMQSALYAMTSEDFTGGATFYHRHNIAPSWSNGLVYVARYGAHKFYRD